MRKMRNSSSGPFGLLTINVFPRTLTYKWKQIAENITAQWFGISAGDIVALKQGIQKMS